MQVSGVGGGHVSVAAQQGMYANFQHQGTPQHHQGNSTQAYQFLTVCQRAAVRYNSWPTYTRQYVGKLVKC